MNNVWIYLKIAVILLLAGALNACVAVPTAPYYAVQEVPTASGTKAVLNVGPSDRTFLLQVEDRTPFGPYELPQTLDMLYQKGYDEVRRQREADFSINVSMWASAHDNPDQRALNTFGGALAGAAAGAIIGGALGDPGAGAAIGAASGGTLGFVSPASAPHVKIDVNVFSNTERLSSQRSVNIDLTHVPPPDVRHVIDLAISKLLRDLPNR